MASVFVSVKGFSSPLFVTFTAELLKVVFFCAGIVSKFYISGIIVILIDGI